AQQSDGALRKNAWSQRDRAGYYRWDDAAAGDFSNSGGELHRTSWLQTICLCRLGHARDVYLCDGAGAADRKLPRPKKPACAHVDAALLFQPFAWDLQLRLVALDHDSGPARFAGKIPGA